MSKIKKRYLDFDIYEQSEVDTISGSLSSEIDTDISSHAASADHDGRYYIEAEVDIITTNNFIKAAILGTL